ncbi:hypothetical protein Esti_003949 [Eimeria stiedai]
MTAPPPQDPSGSNAPPSLPSLKGNKRKKAKTLISHNSPQPPAAAAAGSATAAGSGAAEEGAVAGARGSVLFAPLRVVGKVISGIPFSLSLTGKEAFICCGLSRGFQVFDAARLHQQLMSPRLPASVRCLCSCASLVYAGLKTNIVAFERLMPVLLFSRGHALPVDQLLVVGPLLLSRSKGEVLVWERKDAKLLRRLPLQGAPNLTLMLHANTFVNKLLLARGPLLELWNFNTGQRLHQFSCIGSSNSSSNGSSSSGSGSGSITAAAQSPSPQVVAVGKSCGKIYVFDFAQDELLLEFQHSSRQGAVTSLAFRSDAAAAAGGAAAAAAAAALVSGCANGDLCVWSLSEGRLLETIPRAHVDAVVHVEFLPGEPIMLTSGHDNALVEWIFDTPDGIPRELRARRGQLGIISQMQFYGESATELLTASNLRGRGFVGRTSLVQQQQSCTYSQKKLKTKLAEPLTLQPPSPGSAAATSVACSSCGNFVVVGYEDGRMHKYNLQSSLHRGEFIRELGRSSSSKQQQQEQQQQERWEVQRAHQGAVCGVEALGATLVVSASLEPQDSCLMLWELSSRAPRERVPLPCSGGGISLFKTSGAVAAVSLRSGLICLVDLLSCTVFREVNQLSPNTPLPVACCFCFSPDGRWLAAGCTDSSLFVYDVLSHSVVDWIKFKSQPTAIAFDNSGALLLTAHQHAQGGLLVWINKHVLSPSLTGPLLHGALKKPLPVDEPFAAAAADLDEPAPTAAAAAAGEEGVAAAAAALRRYKSTEQPLSFGALTLSGISPSHLHALMHIDDIKAQSRPQKAPEPLAKAPFFLPSRFEEEAKALSVQGAEDTPPQEEEGRCAEGFQKRSRFFRSRLQKLLGLQGHAEEIKNQAILNYLRSCSPTGAALALSDVGPLAGGPEEEIVDLLRFFHFEVFSRKNADLVQALLFVFLKAHAEWFLRQPAGSAAHVLLGDLSRCMHKEWEALEQQFYRLECSLKFLSHLQME